MRDQPGEQLITTGPAHGPAILFILPLFDEGNRMRRTVRLAMAALAARGVGALLPDLPGQNESLLPTHAASLSLWRTAVTEAVAQAGRPIITAAFRGGCLIDDAPDAAAHWRCAPASGASLLRILLRTRIAADAEQGIATTQAALIDAGATAPLDLGGNRLSPAMLAELTGAEPRTPPAPCRTTTLAGDGDVPIIAGSPLWLRAEPGEDAGFADAIAADLLDWGRTCGVI